MEHIIIKNLKIEDLKNVSSFSHVLCSTCTSKIYRRTMLDKNSQMSKVNCLKLNKAFTLLELLLVIAIISVLAGLVIFNLRPAETLQNASDVKNVANSKDIKKAIEAYILDHGGSLPTSLQGQASGEYTICKQAEESCPEGSISLDELITGGYLSAIPVNTDLAGEKTTGYAIDYNADTFALEVSTEVVATPTPDIVTGLMGWWKMDEASWGTVNDSSGNNNNGTQVNGASITTGKFGNGGNFIRSSSQRVVIPDNNSLEGFSEMTVSAWVNAGSNPADYTTHTILAKGDNTYRLFVGWPKTYSFDMDTINGACYTDSGVLMSNTAGWVHVIGTYDGSNCKIYINGELKTTSPLSLGGAVRTNTYDLWFGNNSQYTSRPWNGKMDEIRLYNRAFSDIEVQALYNYAPGPIAHWKFDEGSGGTVADSSGNNLTATINSGTWVQGKYGNAISLNGSSSSYVYKGSYTPPYNQGSYMLWIKPNDQGGTLWDSNGYLWLNNGTNQVNWYGRNSSPILGGSLPLGEWKHVAVTWGPSLRQIYVDGVLVNSDTNIGSNIPSSFVYIGKTFANYSFYNGIIDDIRLYNYARTQSQIVNDMNNI